MTLNTVNALEIEDFVDLALRFDAEPLIMLVANPYQTIDFQKKFLTFTEGQFAEMETQIDASIPKVRARKYSDAELYLDQLKLHLEMHRSGDNDPVKFAAKNAARTVFRHLPEQLQAPLRRAVQNRRRSAMARAEQKLREDSAQ